MGHDEVLEADVMASQLEAAVNHEQGRRWEIVRIALHN